MRKDMDKVVAEPARIGGRCRIRPQLSSMEWEDLPQRESMRGHLARDHGALAKGSVSCWSPLRRWLDKQVGRPWNRVYSELCATFASRHPRKHDVLHRVNWWVAQRDVTLAADGSVTELLPGCGRYPVDGLYVHPVSGLLQRADGPSEAARRRQNREAETAQRLARRRDLGPTRQLHKVDGQWYVVELAPVRPPLKTRWYSTRDGERQEHWSTDYSTECHDVLLQEVFHLPSYTLQRQYGNAALYAKSKRQASHKELKRCGLSS